jgi:hypothetical protein
VEAETGPLEPAPELALLGGVTETRQPDVAPLRAVEAQEPSDRLRASDRHNGDALGDEVPATALGERLNGYLVADPFHEHDSARVDACGYLGVCHRPAVVSATRPRRARAAGHSP